MSSVPTAVLENARVLWNYHRLAQSVSKADVVVGLGSYDLRVVDRCVQLWRDGLCPRIVFSGARGNWTQGLEDTEAELFSRRALSLGAPADLVLKEDRSTNLGENVTRTVELLKGLGLPHGRILLVTKPNTERRALATALKLCPSVDWSVTSPDTQLEGPYAPGRSLEALIDEMVGDLQCIQRYPAMWFQVEQRIPAPVLKAFEELKAAGYVRHLMKD